MVVSVVPFAGHYPAHLRLAYDFYQEPFANSCFNWDTKAMRSAPPPQIRQMKVVASKAKVTLDSKEIATLNGDELTSLPTQMGVPRKSVVKLLYDKNNLYVWAQAELEPEKVGPYPSVKQDVLLSSQEAFDLYLAPDSSNDLAYRFMVGPHQGSRYDAISGKIDDVMDPRFGKDDPTWNGKWEVSSRVDEKLKLWQTLVTIPFETLQSQTPSSGVKWKANFARYHPLERQVIHRSIWSSRIGTDDPNDRTLFGDLLFE